MQHPTRKLFSAISILGMLILIFGIACVTKTPTTESTPPAISESSSSIVTVPAEVPEEFSKVWETWFTLKERHLNQQTLEASRLSEGAIRGMLQALDDAHASYLNSTDHKMILTELEGKYEGIGARVTMNSANQLTIIAPMPNSPAAKAGIKQGDIILAVNGESTMGLTLLEGVMTIRGAKGSSIELTVKHPDSSTEKITVVRDVINMSNVRHFMLEDTIAHIIVESFADNTDEEFTKLLNELRKTGIKGIVLDLRYNPGGGVGTVVNMTSEFLNRSLVLYEIDGEGRRTEWNSKPGGVFPQLPLVVMVNEFSASGSEVLAGALQDHGRAKVVGTKTFGKGTVNNLHALRDGSAIYFSVALWYTPGGTLIEGSGLTPDEVVADTPGADPDPQLTRALEILKEPKASNK